MTGLSSIRLLHVADVHIGVENYGRLDPRAGVNSRVVDFLRRFDEVIDYALENEVDLAIFAGDAYKTRNPNVTHQREFARRIKRLADADIPVVLLVGNHDQPSAVRRASSVDIFGTLGVRNVILAQSEKVHVVDTRRGVPVQVAAVPYPSRSRLMADGELKNLSLAELDQALQRMVAENIRALAEQLNPQLPAILTAHLSVAEAKLGSEQHVMIGRDVTVLKSLVADPAFDYVALGHIHKHQDVNAGYHPPVVYAGSIERIDFGEEGEPKGFVIADIEKGRAKWRFVPVQARPFVTIQVTVDAEDPMAQVLAEIERHRVADAVVRVIIKVDEEREPLIDERAIRQALEGAHYISAIRKDVDRHQRQRLGAQGAEGLTPAEALRKYLEVTGVSAGRADKLVEYAERIIHPEQG